MADLANGKTSAAKNKKCPFCHQAFTSSSLGRHLDLYIKDRNPKPADDVHDVDEIRNIRAVITRRQPRQRRDGSTTPSSKATPLHDRRSPDLPGQNIEGDAESFKSFYNQANWRATGVINELPPTPRTDPSGWTGRKTTISRGNVKDEITRRKEHIDALDHGHAAKLALDEVLESVKAAKCVILSLSTVYLLADS